MRRPCRRPQPRRADATTDIEHTPAGTPAPVVNKIYAECEKFLSMPATRDKLANVGVIVATLTPEDFGAFIKSEVVRWSAEVKAAGIQPQ